MTKHEIPPEPCHAYSSECALMSNTSLIDVPHDHHTTRPSSSRDDVLGAKLLTLTVLMAIFVHTDENGHRDTDKRLTLSNGCLTKELPPSFCVPKPAALGLPAGVTVHMQACNHERVDMHAPGAAWAHMHLHGLMW
eukprot:366426-Chlamydomonas_euryale.AAC.16